MLNNELKKCHDLHQTQKRELKGKQEEVEKNMQFLVKEVSSLCQYILSTN